MSDVTVRRAPDPGSYPDLYPYCCVCEITPAQPGALTCEGCRRAIDTAAQAAPVRADGLTELEARGAWGDR